MSTETDVTKWLDRGVGLLQQFRSKEDEETFLTAIEHNPTYANAWNELGMVLGMQRRFEESAEALRKTTELNPELEMAWVAYSCLELGQSWTSLRYISNETRGFSRGLYSHT